MATRRLLALMLAISVGFRQRVGVAESTNNLERSSRVVALRLDELRFRLFCESSDSFNRFVIGFCF